MAIKLLYPPLSADNRRRFEIEARAAAGLNHPHVVAVHDFGEHDGMPYLVMERLPGASLADAIARGPLPEQQVRTNLEQVLAALSAAHAAGVLHRDIKPGNILLTEAGTVKIADFGIAKRAESTHTVAGQIVGTMAYLSPDRIAGRPATVADDLYAVGVVGYEALTGRRPDPEALARAVADPGLGAVIERATTRDPQRRFHSAEDMRAALSKHPGSVRPPTRVLAQPLPDPATMVAAVPRRRPRVSIGLAVAAVAVLVTVIAFVVDSAARPTVPSPVVTPTSVAPPGPSVAPTSAPAPPTTTAGQVDGEGPPKGRGNNGNGKGPGNGKGNGPKPKPSED